VRAVAGADVAAIYGTNIENVRRLSHEHGGEAYAEFDAFLAHRPMDIVIVGSPSGVHAAHGIAAARQGLHVLVEKPIDIKTERADALIAEAEKAGIKLGVIFQDRLKPGIRRIKEFVDRRTLDRRFSPMPASSGTGRRNIMHTHAGEEPGRWMEGRLSSIKESIRSTSCCGSSGT